MCTSNTSNYKKNSLNEVISIYDKYELIRLVLFIALTNTGTKFLCCVIVSTPFTRKHAMKMSFVSLFSQRNLSNSLKEPVIKMYRTFSHSFVLMSFNLISDRASLLELELLLLLLYPGLKGTLFVNSFYPCVGCNFSKLFVDIPQFA